MDLNEIKNKFIGSGLRRLRYEARYKRLRGKYPYELGRDLGLSSMDSIMLQEIWEYQLEKFAREVNQFSQN